MNNIIPFPNRGKGPETDLALARAERDSSLFRVERAVILVRSAVEGMNNNSDKTDRVLTPLTSLSTWRARGVGGKGVKDVVEPELTHADYINKLHGAAFDAAQDSTPAQVPEDLAA